MENKNYKIFNTQYATATILSAVDITSRCCNIGLDFIISDFYEVCHARLTSAAEKMRYLLRKQTYKQGGENTEMQRALQTMCYFSLQKKTRSQYFFAN